MHWLVIRYPSGFRFFVDFLKTFKKFQYGQVVSLPHTYPEYQHV
jgi:hypothetical protein